MKSVEEMGQLPLRNTDAGIRHRQFDVIVAPPQRDVNAAFEGMLERIRKQIKDDLLPHVFVHVDQFWQGHAIHGECQSALLDR